MVVQTAGLLFFRVPLIILILFTDISQSDEGQISIMKRKRVNIIAGTGATKGVEYSEEKLMIGSSNGEKHLKRFAVMGLGNFGLYAARPYLKTAMMLSPSTRTNSGSRPSINTPRKLWCWMQRIRRR
jgi:hypothetical protein